MRQIDLMQIAAGVKIGQAYKLTRRDMLGCADGMLRSALDGPPRQSDIDDFIKSASQNWGVEFQYDPIADTWTMHKVVDA
jgi:hypothetical protein